MVVSLLRQTSASHVTVVFEDGSELLSTLNTITDNRLFSGRDLDEAALSQLRTDSEHALAFEYAAEILSRRQHSGKELHDKLTRKGLSEDTAGYCVRKMTENGLMDDGSYAASVARHYAAKGYGAGRVRNELSKRGISRELLDDTLSEMPENNDKIDKFISTRLKDPEDPAEVRKVSNALYRRGFSWAEIRSALARFNAEVEEESI